MTTNGNAFCKHQAFVNERYKILFPNASAVSQIGCGGSKQQVSWQEFLSVSIQCKDVVNKSLSITVHAQICEMLRFLQNNFTKATADMDVNHVQCDSRAFWSEARKEKSKSREYCTNVVRRNAKCVQDGGRIPQSE